MSVYSISVFLHIVGALGLFAALGLEWASLQNLRTATTAEHLRAWTWLQSAIRRVAGPSMLTLLATGIHMSTRWGQQAWIGLGLVGIILLGALGGGLSGRRFRAISRAAREGDGPLPPSLLERLRDPRLRLSIWFRTALGLGIVFLMSTKPSGAIALISLLVAAGIGLAAGLWTLRGGPRPATHPRTAVDVSGDQP